MALDIKVNSPNVHVSFMSLEPWDSMIEAFPTALKRDDVMLGTFYGKFSASRVLQRRAAWLSRFGANVLSNRFIVNAAIFGDVALVPQEIQKRSRGMTCVAGARHPAF